MNITDLLNQQHREADALFEAFRQAQESDKPALSLQLAEALALHSIIEERWVYPASRRIVGEGFVQHAEAQHELMKDLVHDILRARQDTRALNDTMRELEKVAKDHMADEEENLFPQLKQKAAEEDFGLSCEDIVRTASQVRREEMMQLGEAPPSA